MASEERELRWGIVGCGNISHDFVLAMRQCRHRNRVVALGARDLARAEALRSELQLVNTAKAYGSYQELFADTDVDVVYIGSVNHEHKPLTLAALRAGKHVLCEKPLGCNVAEVKEICEAARTSGRFLMEATWSRFFPVYSELRKIIQNGELGELRGVGANFSIPSLPPNRQWPEKGATPLNDIGSYCIQLALFCFQERPTKVTAVGKIDEKGCDKWTSMTLQFSHQRKAVLFCSGEDVCPSSAWISFANGYVELPRFFWCPNEMLVHKGEESDRVPPPKALQFPFDDAHGTEYRFNHGSGMRYEADHVFECLERGLTQSDVHPLEESLRVVEVLDTVRRQTGIIYGQDSD